MSLFNKIKVKDISDRRKFMPTDIKGCNVWIDASDAQSVTIDTGVSQINDKSGNGNHLKQGTGSLQPAYTIGAQNNQNVMTFDSTDDHLFTDGNIDLSGGGTIFITASNTTAKASNGLMSLRSALGVLNSSLEVYWQIGDGSGDNSGHLTYVSNRDATDGVLTANNMPPVPGEYYVVSYKIASEFVTKTMLNNVEIIEFSDGSTVTDNENLVPGNPNLLYLGIGVDAGAPYLNGTIAEVIIYDEVLSDKQVQQVNDYLMSKWAVETNYYKSSFTPNDIPDCQMWFDAADEGTITLNGSNVSAWADKSSNEWSAEQSNSSLQPAYSDTLNGKKVITSDGTNYLEIPSSTGSFNWFHESGDGWNLFCVARPDPEASWTLGVAFCGNNTSTGADGFITFLDKRSVSHQMACDVYRSVGGTVKVSLRSKVNTSNEDLLQIFSFWLDDTVQLDVRNGGWDIDSDTTFLSSGSGAAGNNMNLLSTGTLFKFVGKYCELIAYDRLISKQEFHIVEQYLEKKWGVEYKMNPHTFGTPTMWLDAADPGTIIFNGSDVSAIKNKGATAIVTEQTTASRQPLYDGNALDTLSRQGIDFDRSATQVLVTDYNWPAEFTCFLVLRTASSVTPKQRFISNFDSSSINDGEWIINHEGGGALRFYFNGGNITGSTLSTSTTYVITTYADSDGNVNLSLNGTNQGSDTTGTTSTLYPLSIGEDRVISADEYFDGIFFELIFFDSKLESQKIDLMERALGAKWGVTIS